MEDVEFYVLDADLNLLTVLDGYETLEFKYNYHDHSTCYGIIEASERYRDLFMPSPGDVNKKFRILVRSDDLFDKETGDRKTLTDGFLVETVVYTDKNKSNIELYAYSMSTVLSWRRVLKQQVYKGNIEDAMRYFVNNNCINTDVRRVISKLQLGQLSGIQIDVDEAFNNKALDEALWEVCKKTETSYKVMINHETKQLEFVMYEGVDRSAIQQNNSHVVFSKEFENVLTQSYVDDSYGYRNCAFVAGEGEGESRKIVEIGKELSGWDRRETFFDARDLQSEYDDNGNEIIIPEGEYNKLLYERGSNKLKEYQRIQTFESEINPYSQFTFDKDYFLGDIISNRNDEIGIIMHNRVVVANETFNRQGYSLNLEFGTAVPTLLDKLKRGVK